MVKTVQEYVHQRTCKDCQKSDRDGGVSSVGENDGWHPPKWGACDAEIDDFLLK